MKLFQKLINLLNKSGIDASKIDLNGKVINLTSEQIQIMSNNFRVDTEGNLQCRDALMDNADMNNIKIHSGKIDLFDDTGTSGVLNITSGNFNSNYRSFGTHYQGPDGYVSIEADFAYSGGTIFTAPSINESTNYTLIQNGSISALTVTQRSLEEAKKNFIKFENGLDIIKNIDIYKYNLKAENDKDKKHIGFVIGDKYKYSKEITSKENDGVDIYSFVSVCCKAIQEQQEQIEKLQNQIKELGGNK